MGERRKFSMKIFPRTIFPMTDHEEIASNCGWRGANNPCGGWPRALSHPTTGSVFMRIAERVASPFPGSNFPKAHQREFWLCRFLEQYFRPLHSEKYRRQSISSRRREKKRSQLASFPWVEDVFVLASFAAKFPSVSRVV
jgi:hypothetical protein